MPEYYNAFISYGRADSKDFATKLCEKLTEKGFKIWFDQNDIPLGVDFQNQIDDGITKADNFLFIIAPHAVNSPYCLKEIELAVKYNKRIIPLLHVEQITYEIWQQRNLQGTLEQWETYQQKGLHSSFPNMHPEISRINWVYFQENLDDFDTSFTGLIELFNRHQDYVKQHTNILLKALDWERNYQQTRYLLIGKERQESEKWLKFKFTDEQPPCIPTDLHCEFICESNKNANNLMTQVFLAFAEADQTIMQQIRKSLMREGITVWSFQTDVKTGKDFQTEINRGIAGADNIIYLLSPEAIKSEYCQQEIAYALSLNKRIIPLLISATHLTEIPTEIRNLQFIDLTTESYQETIDKLLKEIQSEVVYYERHKILLVKALKWQQQNRNPSILLRGYNLEQYQSWLELCQSRNVNLPTDLQTEFIAESAKQLPNLALDVFVSYSRADADFARRLNDALQTQGKTTWFDQESIATGTDFQQEIYRGIEQSDNFLFIISPESVNSPYCADEVEYAKSLNKRFVTVLHRKVNPAELHPELAKVQWLDFHRYGGDFYANFSELVRTLDTDREYVREHTQMSQKALEWQRDNKNIDLLLRESKYVKASEWLQLAETNSKEPPVTEEIKEFILESKELVEKEQKQKQWQRQRTIAGMAVFSLIISLLAVWSEMQRRKAVISEKNSYLRAEMSTLEPRLNSSLEVQMDVLKLGRKLQQVKTATSAIQIQGADLLRQTFDLPRYKEINRLEGHENNVLGVAFSPEGDLIASASDETVKLWKPDGTLVRTLDHEYAFDVAFSPKGDLIASANADKTVKLWKPDGTLVRTLTGHVNGVEAVEFSPKGDLIASASLDWTVKLWKPDGTLVRTLTGHEKGVLGVEFSPKGDLIASASWDETVKLWQPDGTLVRTLTGHEKGVLGVEFSPKGDLIASASWDETVKLWQPDGTLVRTLTGHEHNVEAVAFSPEGDLIASASRDGTVKLWKPDGTLVRTLDHEYHVFDVAFSPKGDLIASANGRGIVKLWKPDGTLVRTLTGHEHNVEAVAFSPEGDLIASASRDGKVKLWKPDSTLVRTLTGHEDDVFDVEFSPEGDLIASASGDGTVKLWKPDGTFVRTLLDEVTVEAVEFSPKGDLIASASVVVELWQPDGTLVRTLYEVAVSSVAFSAKGDLIASASDYGKVKLWKPDGTLVRTLDHEDDVFDVAFSPKGDLIASVSGDKTVKLWQPDGTLVRTLDHEYYVSNVAFSPKGDLIASASDDKTVKLWQPDGTLVRTLTGHENGVNSVAFSPKGDLIASASRDGTVKLWKPDGTLVRTLIGHENGVNSVAFSPKGDLIASASDDKTVKLWRFNRDDLIAHACQWMSDYLKNNPNVTEEERRLCGVEVSATALFLQGEKLIEDKNFDAAILAYERAQKLDVNLEITARDWNSICWDGSLYKQAKDVMFACEKAVQLAPEDGYIRDSRGLARALTGDFPGAIKDFEAYIKWTDNAEEKAQRQGWVDALKKGENPFTEEVLEKLR